MVPGQEDLIELEDVEVLEDEEITCAHRVENVRSKKETESSRGGQSGVTGANSFVFTSGPADTASKQNASNTPSGCMKETTPRPMGRGTTRGAEKSWARMVEENKCVEKGTPLQEVPRGNGEVRMVAEELDLVANIWGHCAMGYFSGQYPGKEAIRKLIVMWKV